ncbi:hypothetical protein [Actinocorallia aurea]
MSIYPKIGEARYRVGGEGDDTWFESERALMAWFLTLEAAGRFDRLNSRDLRRYPIYCAPTAGGDELQMDWMHPRLVSTRLQVGSRSASPQAN